MGSINITIQDTLVSLPLKRSAGDGRLQIGYRNTWFFHGVPDMLEILSDDIVQRTLTDDECAEMSVHLVLDANHCVLSSVVDATSDALADVLERYAHFFDNLQPETP